ncbi:hypothetical protein FGO68_gene4584 [Halteria grandinella]|uniref:Myb-like domain-containing protein n=1 Tax=Halteria grandinella TaxID=5974 RepID=A0A8J8TA80_HALGN|nr:hypothetical protein FGO68_gene4584 [Halteria grandinella]
MQINTSSEQKYNNNQSGALTNQLIDSMFANNNNTSRVDDSGFQRSYGMMPSQMNSQQAQAPQNNYYYNFNNNFLGGNAQNNSLMDTSTTNKQVKSIEIQVTPEKLQGEGNPGGLGAAGGVGTGNQDDEEMLKNGKKRRRRRRQTEPEVKQEPSVEIGRTPWGPGYPPQHPQGYYGGYQQPPYYGAPAQQQQYNPFYQQPPGYPPYAQYTPSIKLLPGGHTYPPPPSPGMHYYHPPPPHQAHYPPPQQPNFEEKPTEPYVAPVVGSLRDFSRTMLYQFSNEQLRQLVQQIDVYIQMLYQFLLYPSRRSSLEQAEQAINKVKVEKRQPGLASVANKDPTKYRAYCLLYEFISKKDGILKTLNLPTYKVPLESVRPIPQQGANKKKQLSTLDEPIVLNLHPQVSFYQSPLLEIAPEVIKQMTKANSGGHHNDREVIKSTTKFFKRFQPLVNPFLLPISRSIIPSNKSKSKSGKYMPFFKRPIKRPENEEEKKEGASPDQEYQQDEDDEYDDIDKVQHIHQLANSITNNRRKFTLVDDNFLLLGLRQHGYKQVASIRYDWLPRKTECEIKHRYKNLTCAKAADNLIKRWKNTHSTPLSEYELQQLARAVRWFQPGTTRRWGLIARCFFPNRSPKFLSDEYQGILHDQQKAEKFGRLMLRDSSATINRNPSNGLGDDDDDNFEEMDLDEHVKQPSIEQNQPEEHTDDEQYEEHSLDNASIKEGNRRQQKSLMKQIDRIMKLELYEAQGDETEEEIVLL